MYEPLLLTENYKNTVYSDAISSIFKDGELLSYVVPNEKHVIFGTNNGKIYVINHLGRVVCTLQPFKTPIKAISLDITGDFIAVISNTSKAHLIDIGAKEINFTLDLGKIITAVAVCPQVATRSSQKSISISISQRIILYQKYWLNDKKINIHVSDSPINYMWWYDKFLSWTSNSGAGVYNMDTKEWISHIPFQTNMNKTLLDRYCFHWIDNERFLVSYGATIKYCMIKQRDITKLQISDSSSKALPMNFVEITNIFNMDNKVIGLGYRDNQIMCILEEDRNQTIESDDHNDIDTTKELEQSKDTFLIIKSLVPSCVENSKQFTITGMDRILFNDCQADSITVGFISKESFLVVSTTNDIIFAKPRSCDQILEWLIENKLYERALEYATLNSKKLLQFSVDEIQNKFLFHNLKNDNYQLISENIKIIPTNDNSTWEIVINHFINKKHLHLLSQKLPTYDECPLQKETYSKIVEYFIDNIEHDLANIKFIDDFILQYYKHDCFDINQLCVSIESCLNSCSNDDKFIQISSLLGTIYILTMRYTDALDIYITIKSEQCFTILNDYMEKIDPKYILKQLIQLFEINFIVFTNIIIQHSNIIQIQSVIDYLSKHDKNLLLLFLKKLHKQDPILVTPYINSLICLYIELKEDNLIELLKQSTDYDLIKITGLCEQNKLYSPLVYLYEIMGNYVAALELVTHKLANLDMAIDICKRVDDEDLWDILLNYCIESPNQIKILIENMGNSLNISKLLNKIPAGFTIPKLNESLKKIMVDYSIRLELNQLCNQIMKNENVVAFANYCNRVNQGMSINYNDICSICNYPICFNDVDFIDKSMVFYCGHCYHYTCLKYNNSCSITDKKLACPQCISGSIIHYHI